MVSYFVAALASAESTGILRAFHRCASLRVSILEKMARQLCWSLYVLKRANGLVVSIAFMSSPPE